MEQSRHSVEVNFVTGYHYSPVSGFDFGDFAILLTYDWMEEGGQFTVYYDNKYQDYQKSLERESRQFRDKIEEFSFCISVEIVEKIRQTFKDHRHVAYGVLFSLLENCIPRDILPIFFKE